jgi:signal transduction histidine kinase
MEFASTEETRLHVQHITSELEKTRATLEKLEKSKSDFISVAAHELKTPLTLIEGYVSMLKDTLPQESSRKDLADLYLKGVHAGTRRLREIVDDMIDVSMIDNNLLSLNFQPLWINRLLDSIQRELSESIQLRNISLNINRFPGSDEMIFADGERLFQAFRNVIMNGIKYTPDGGKVNVDGRLLPGFIEITVSDTGIGIDPEDHSRIFEKFGRLGNVSLHSSGKTKFKGGGPGLGLPITKGIIDAHGGAIWVESIGYDEKSYPGSTFHIMLPLRKTPPDDKTAKLFKNFIEAN